MRGEERRRREEREERRDTFEIQSVIENISLIDLDRIGRDGTLLDKNGQAQSELSPATKRIAPKGYKHTGSTPNFSPSLRQSSFLFAS